MDNGYQRFGPFLIVRTLGRGGMGEVFVARTPWADNPVAALKRLRPDVARVPTFAERFQHESQLAVRLEHENVVGTLDVGSVNGQLYVASELVLGKDTGLIADRLRERGQGGPAAVAIRLMIDVLTGLAYVHEALDRDKTPLALVHRDITPGNLLVSYDGVTKLADFGLAKSLLTERANLTQHGEILGTPHYLAPEIIRGDGATPSSDLYGLGAVMYRFLTGVPPHHGTTPEVLMKVLTEEPRPLSELRPDLSPWFVTCVHSLLTKAPSKRPSNARQLVAQLGLEAKAAGLLVARAAVGRWLGDLFEEEKTEELQEKNRLTAMPANNLAGSTEGTVVLAARSTSGAPITAAFADPGFGQANAEGTELAVQTDNDTDAQGTPSAGLGAAVPSDVTDASQVAAVIELGALDGMPTRAVTMQSDFLRFNEESGTQEMASRPNLVSPRAEAVSDVETQFNPLLGQDDEAPTALPGFIDPKDAVPHSYAPQDTNPDPASLPASRVRPRSASEVVVTPLSGSMQARSEPNSQGYTSSRPKPGGSAAPDKAYASPRAKAGGAGSSDRDFLISPDFGEDRRLFPDREVAGRTPPRVARAAANAPVASGPPSAGRNILLLAAMLAVAVLLGVFVGALVVSYRNPGVAVVARRGPVQEQLFRVQTALVARVERGEVVPAEVWSKVTQAHAALQAGDEKTASALLSEVEAEN